ncbi:MAG: hypothetical protein EBW14_07215 [Oxalobacteraceae bacterium]|nr:hypothetical protein [Oxalobacteraceae bacterium]
MVVQNSKTDPSLFASVDFRAFFETLRVRWWVIPAVLGTSVGFLQLQDSDLRTEPATVVVSRDYEISSPQDTLGVIGVYTQIAEFPKIETQLLMLRSEEVRGQVEEQIGKEVDVQVPDSWTTPVTFVCNDPVKSDCEKAIDVYVTKAVEIRQKAIATGIRNQLALLKNLQATSKDPILPAQVLALEALVKDFKVDAVLLDSSSQEIGGTVTEVRRPTLVMGLAAGAVLALLLLLQLTYTDSRVRSVRQLVRITGSESFIGTSSKKNNSVREKRAAIALRHAMNASGSTVLRFLPLRNATTDQSTLEHLAQLAGASHKVSEPFAQLNVADLVDATPGEGDVILVKRNRDLRKDVLEVLTALQRSRRPLAGVLLID